MKILTTTILILLIVAFSVFSGNTNKNPNGEQADDQIDSLLKKQN